MKKLFLILFAAAGMMTTAAVEAADKHGLMNFDFTEITEEHCKTADKGIESLILNGDLKPPPSPASHEYRFQDWEEYTYPHKHILAGSFLIYQKCYYDSKATEIRIVDMHSGRSLAGYTEKNGFEVVGKEAEKKK